MKNKNITIAIILTISIIGCKKNYLDLDPVNSYTYYNFAQNEGQVEQAVTGCYRQLFPIYNSYMWLWGEMLSDNTSFRFNPNDRGGIETEKLDEFVGNSNEGTILNTYRDCFEGILRSNYVLESLKKVPFTSDSIKSIRTSEAYFFRAFHYFNLVRLYGDVPLVKKVITKPDENTATVYPRVPVQQIYDELIIPDAIAATSNLPTTVPASQKGRLTKGAAQLLLAKVYLTQNKFSDALPILNAISGYSLNPNYESNFNPATKNGIESIFEIQVAPIPASAGGFSFGFMNQWAPWGTGNIFWPVSNSRGGLNQPTNDLNNAYEINDIRKAVTIQSSGLTPNIILGMKKFKYPNVVNTGINDAQWPIYRYAEVVLSQAECLNEAGFPNSQAFTLLNSIRTRAGLPNKTLTNSNPSLAINTQAEFRLAIEKERRIEFAGEAHRWFDLLRTGRAVNVMTAHGIAEKLLKPTTITDPAAFTKIKTLIAIPFKEIQQFGYPQNPDWN